MNNNNYNQKNIRNFAIIAHVDHGKSTLSDRFIEITNGIQAREMTDCVLDNMDLEKEKGITIKARCIRLDYEFEGTSYVLNLVDTPGHVDFQYEVEKSLSTVGIVILLIDATQGVGSQTLSNYFLAKKNPNIEIIIAINKVDSMNANIDMCKRQIETVLKIDLSTTNIFYISAREGTGVKNLLEEGIIKSKNSPDGEQNAPFRGLIFDSWYDNYLGIIALVYVRDGKLSKKTNLITKSNNVKIEVNKFGYMKDKMIEASELNTGEIGYLVTNIKEPNIIRIGDTLVNVNEETAAGGIDPLPGFRPSVPVVFCSLYLDDPDGFQDALKSLHKLYLNDSSFFFEPERSAVLGMGFRCGFLGLLHMEIILERLSREYNLEFIVTIPNVIYRIKIRGEADYVLINNASDLPANDKLEVTEEPIVLVSILTTEEYIGTVKNLCFARRGVYEDEVYMDGTNLITFRMPLAEIILDFQDQIKSITSGYASYSYTFIEYEAAPLVCLNFLVNDENYHELSCIIHKNQAEKMARHRCIKLKENLPRAQVEIKIQGCINGKIIAGERISPYRKDVIAHCSGGDVNRKNKLLKKQKKGKKNLNREVNIEPSVFVKILKF